MALIVTALGVFAAAVTLGARPDPRPMAMFGGSPSRNPVNRVDRNIPTKWDIKKGRAGGVLWSLDIGSVTYGSPVVLGERIFIGTNNGKPRDPAIRGDRGVLMCFRTRDGRFLWQAVHDKLPSGRVNDWPQVGIASTPAGEGDRLYYVNNRCELICADVKGLADGNQGVRDEQHKDKTDADILWRLDMMTDLGVFPHNLAVCSPLIVGGLVFVVTGNGVDEGHVNIPSPDAPSFLAVNKWTGRVVWKSNAPGRKILHGQWSNPVYAEAAATPQVIFPGGDGFLYAFEPRTGKLLWKFDCNPKAAVYAIGPQSTRNHFMGTPVVHNGRLYVGVGDDPEYKTGVGHLWCVDLAKAVTNGRVNKGHDVSPVNDNFDPKAAVNVNSALAWHYGGKGPGGARGYLFGRTLSTCAVHDGLCYAADLDGFVYCFDARTGEKYWEHDTQSDTWSSPYWVGGHVYIGNEDGEVHVFKHGKTKKLVARVEMEGKVRATPVAANGVLYVVTQNPCKLYAIGRP